MSPSETDAMAAQPSAVELSLRRRCDRIRAAIAQIGRDEGRSSPGRPAAAPPPRDSVPTRGGDPAAAAQYAPATPPSPSTRFPPEAYPLCQLDHDIRRIVGLLPTLRRRHPSASLVAQYDEVPSYHSGVARALSQLPTLSSPWADVVSGHGAYHASARPFPEGRGPSHPAPTRTPANAAREEIRRLGNAAVLH